MKAVLRAVHDMLRYLVFMLLMLLPACNPWEATPTSVSPTSGPVETSSNPEVNTDARWLEATTEGVTIGIMTPDGWFAEAMDGLMIAEHISPVEGSTPTAGILVYIFAPPLSEFTLASQAEENFALHVLQQVIEMPTHVGSNVNVSEPIGFQWAGRDAAYYLLTGSDGTRTIVLGIEVPDLSRLVVANVSVPAGREDALRETLPRVLDGLTINDVRFEGVGLNLLPDPLPFPEHISSANPSPAPVSSR
jgi:hypothetical protein